MYGLGIVRGLGVTLKHFIESYVDDFRWFGKRRATAGHVGLEVRPV